MTDLALIFQKPEQTKDAEGKDTVTFWGVRFDNTDARIKIALAYVLVMGAFFAVVYYMAPLFDSTLGKEMPFVIGTIAAIGGIGILMNVILAPVNPNQNLGDGISSDWKRDESQGRVTLNDSGSDGIIRIPWTDVINVFIQGSVVVLEKKQPTSSIFKGKKVYLKLKTEDEAQLFYDFVMDRTHP